MKNLIVHPKDTTTDFLSPIYAPLRNKTIVRGGVTKSEVQKLIQSHNRVIILGHGSPDGLLSKDQFPDAGLYIVDESMVISLKNKSNCMFIWCYADQFVQRHGLSGLCTGMFISELGEADYWGFEDIDKDLIDQSNYRFASLVSKYIYEPLEVLYQNLLDDYELLSKANPIVRFNRKRINLTRAETNKSPNKVTF